MRKTSKWYFYDNGIRNAVIGSFQPLALRQDVGHLWENYLISERLKKRLNTNISVDLYMWRTYDNQEIDLIEDSSEGLKAYEFKWGDKMPKAPKAFIGAYPEVEYQVINRDNYLDFIC